MFLRLRASRDPSYRVEYTQYTITLDRPKAAALLSVTWLQPCLFYEMQMGRAGVLLVLSGSS
jgi:hypothetical protein